MRVDVERLMSAGSSMGILGIAWLLFWLGPAFQLFEADPRWAHNFAFALIFIIVGLASYKRTLSCGSIAVVASFLIVPTELAFWSGGTATVAAASLLALMLLVCAVERQKGRELLEPGPRLNAWLHIHLLNFAYLGIAHMPLIFFLVRWLSGDPYLEYLPIEHEPSTSIFNAMLFILVIIAIAERYVKNIGRLTLSKAGVAWAVLMLVLPLVSIAILGE
jgi:hypothetical protein